MINKNQKPLHTQFGTAKLNQYGYYQITTSKEGYFGKYLHRLIWEKFYNFKIPLNYIIHHKNGNKQDNCILNLQIMKIEEHSKYHNTGKTASVETKLKMSKQKTGENNHFYGKQHNLSSKLKMSKSKNSTGFFRVYKSKEKTCKQGFRWVYRYMVNGKMKSIKSCNLKKLKEKVEKQGLKWIELNC